MIPSWNDLNAALTHQKHRCASCGGGLARRYVYRSRAARLVIDCTTCTAGRRRRRAIAAVTESSAA